MDSDASVKPPPPPPPPPPPAAAAEDGALWTRAWGPSRAFLGILVLLLVVTVEAAIVAGFDPTLKSLGAKLLLQALLAVSLVGVSFTMAAPRGALLAPAETLGLRRPRDGALRLALIGYVAYFAFALVYSSLLSPHQKDLTRDLGYGDGALASITAGVLIVAVAPVAEEIFFRGFLFGGLRSRLTFVWSALISAAIFGAFHYTGSGSLTVLPQLMALGLVQAWLYERSGSIYPTIALHMFNNALAFAIITH